MVSVIIPVHNTVEFLTEAINSVLSQTCERFEVIVVDDGSDPPLADCAPARDPRVKMVRRSKRGGPSTARNDGWRIHADPRSAFVAFLDADDAWDPDKLRLQIEAFDADSECVAVGTLMRYVSTSGRELGIAGQTLGPEELARIAAGDLQPCQLSSLTVRRAALAATGGFDARLGLLGSEDLDLVARLAAIGRLIVLPQILGSYRIHPRSAMAQHRLRINRAGRFVRRRLEARRTGGDLTWEGFLATEVYSWRDRRRDMVERCYRGAALWFAEGHLVTAVGYGVAALAIGPAYTLRRASRQLLGGRLHVARPRA